MATRIVRVFLRMKPSKTGVRQSVKVVSNCRIPGRATPVQLHLGYLSLRFEGGIPEGQRKKLRKNLCRLWLKYFQNANVDIDWVQAESELDKRRNTVRQANATPDVALQGRAIVATMRSDDPPTRFCCGACEHVARTTEREATYAPSPAVLVPDDGSGLMLVAISRDHRRSIPLARGMRATIGRDRSCDIVFDDQFLSQRTCELSVTAAGDVFIRDLNSACGTVVNDARAAGPYRLHERDAIHIGSMVLVFANA